jgi:hypothetical protein
LNGKLSGFWHLGRQEIKRRLCSIKSIFRNSKKIE